MNSVSENARLVFHRYDYAVFLTFIAYAASSVVVPVVLVQLANDLNFSLKDGGMSLGGALHMGRTVTMVIMLLLSGFVAGRFGARKTMGLFILIMATGIGLCSLAPVYALVLAGLLIAGLGEGYIEAIATPFVQMLHSTDTGRYMNFTHGFWSVGVFFTVLASGLALILGVSWRTIIGTVFCFALIPAALLLLPEAKGHEFPERKESLNAGKVWHQMLQIMSVKRFWGFFAAIFFAGGSEYCLTFWLASFLQLSLKESAFTGGIATACFAAGMAFGRTFFGVKIPQHRLFDLLVWCAMLGIVTGLLIPLLQPGLMPTGLLLIVLFIILFLVGVATAPFWPTLQTYSITRLPQELDTTMIFVLLSTAGVPGCGFFALLMGIIGDHFGLTVSFYLVPLCYILMLALVLYDHFKPLFLKGNTENVIQSH